MADRYSWWQKWTSKEGRRWLFWLAMERLIRTLSYPNWRTFLIRCLGAKIGQRSFVHDVVFQNVYSNGFSNLQMGDRVSIQSQCFIDLADKVILEDDVTVSAGVYILTHEDCGAKMGKPLAKYFPPSRSPVYVKQGSWIGARATLLSGVTVGSHSVVGACSLVNKDVPDWVVVAGVPAKEIRKIKDGEKHEHRIKVSD